MVEAAKKAAETSAQDPAGIVGGVIQNLANQLPWIFAALIILALAIGIYYVTRNHLEERKEKDHPVYANYKRVVEACEAQANPERIQYRRRWFFPPFKKDERSAKAVTQTGELIGYYRGHCYTQADDCFNLLLYKTHSFIFFENLFVLKIPHSIKYSREVEDKDGIKQRVDEKVDLPKMYTITGYGDYQIWCIGFEATSYFKYPVCMDEDKKIFDMSRSFSEKQIEVAHQELLANILAKGSQQVEKAMEHNPHVVSRQKGIERTDQEEKSSGD